MSARWTKEQIEELRGLIAKGHNAGQVAAILGRNRKAVISRAQEYSLGPWHSTPGTKAGRSVQIPDDFEQRWAEMPLLALAQHYRAGANTVRDWIKVRGLQRTKGPQVVPCPADFVVTQRGLTISELMVRYGVGRDMIRRWLAENGIQRERFAQPGTNRFIKPNAYLTAPKDRPHVDVSRAGMAADYLRKFGPVIRCKPDGSYDPKGTCWRRNGRVLTADEVIERAVANKWAPDEWRKIAA